MKLAAILSLAVVPTMVQAAVNEVPSETVAIVKMFHVFRQHKWLNEQKEPLREQSDDVVRQLRRDRDRIHQLDQEIEGESNNHARRDKEHQLATLRTNWATFASAKRNKLHAQERRLYVTALKQVQQATATVAKRKGLTLVIFMPVCGMESATTTSRGGGPLINTPTVGYIGASPRLDITQEVIDELSKTKTTAPE